MTIRECFDEAVRTVPAKTALRWFDGENWRQLAYGELSERVLGCYAVLLREGLTARGGDSLPLRLAIMMANSPDWLAIYLALAGSSLTAVPLDPKLRGAEARHILTDSGASVVFVDGHSEPAVAEAAAAGWGGRVVTLAELGDLVASLTPEELATARAVWAKTAPGEDTLASIIYTSGTTGVPKGACLTHGNFTANAVQTLERVPFYDTDRYLLVLPLFHAYAFTLSFVIPLMLKAEIDFARNLRTVAADIAALRPTVLMAVPLMAEMLYQRARELVATLRIVGVGGAPLAKSTIEGLMASGVKVMEGYGITECAPGVSYPRDGAYVPGTVGTPLSGIEWRICNTDETGAGELRVKGPNVMRGYWNNPGATVEAFDADGFYRTGDIVRTGLDGNLVICGRTKALIVNREGKNIYPEELERVIAHDPMFRDVLVLGYRVGGAVGEHVGVIVVPDPDAFRAEYGALSRGAAATAVRKRVLERCRGELADYKLPRKVEVRFVPLERTPAMKIRRYLYQRALDE